MIQEKEYLPVKALHFGDTGTPVDRKQARYNLGPLECNGDMLFENMITFRKVLELHDPGAINFINLIQMACQFRIFLLIIEPGATDLFNSCTIGMSFPSVSAENCSLALSS